MRADWPTARVHSDEVGVSPAISPKFQNVSIPFGALVPRTLDGLVAAGRHISCDRNSHGFMREIPQCWVTGQAAGVGAAVAAAQDVQPRNVNIATVQTELLRQGVNLRAPERTDDASPVETAPERVTG